jgi:HAD superfamily hydrolase (TIGR01509 family)
MTSAFLFDLNGTMIDDMEYHVVAWTSLLNGDLKAGLSDKEIRSQMYGKNDELFHRLFGNRFSPQEIAQLSLEKEKRYQKAFKPHLKLIRGLDHFLAEAKTLGIPMAIGTAAIPFNVDFVLDKLRLRSYFKVVVTADDVAVSKPDPEVYLECARRLGKDPAGCLVFEDAPKGVEAALNAGMQAIVIRSTLHADAEFSPYSNVVRIINDYTEISAWALMFRSTSARS